MELKTGDLLEGQITHITSFGAFIKLFDCEEEGLVHISEVANEYVTDINTFIKVGDKVNVKVLGRNEQNKLKLSIKQASAPPKKQEEALFIHKKTKNTGFEDKLMAFMKKSEEKLIDVRRNLKNKQGITKKKKK
ncbi:MAG: S1 RNA-binding domain-containing protein [bacterium]|nr:S1 RNA-binding domain-containing protein [bacterium]